MLRVVLAVGALAALSLSLSGCGDTPDTPAKMIPPIGGFYTDPNVFKPSNGSFAGLYVVSDRDDDELTNRLHFIGSDDGTAFWNVYGAWTDQDMGEFVAYFSHRNDGSPDMPGVLSDAGIAWKNATHGSSRTWAPQKTPSFSLKSTPFTDPSKVGGFYEDPALKGSGFAGARLIGANYYPNLTFVGTNDGTTFWTVIGSWDKKPGQFRANFAPIGGGGQNTTGKVDHDAILWTDGHFWQKKMPGSKQSTQAITV